MEKYINTLITYVGGIVKSGKKEEKRMVLSLMLILKII